MPLLTPIPVTNPDPDLAPPVSWMFPSFANTGFGKTLNISSPTGFDGKGAILDQTNGFTLLATGTKLNLAASDPTTVATTNETLLGDRVLVGNNLPAKWLQYNTVTSQLEFVSDQKNNSISTTGSAVIWDNPTGASDRYRNTRAVSLSNLGVTDRGGFWEISSAS